MKTLREHKLSILFVLIWSSAYVAGALCTGVIAPLTVTLWRFVVASALLGLIAWRRGEAWPRDARAWARAAGTGVILFAVQFGALYTGLARHMPTATTALIACSSPLAIAALSAVFGWERLGRRQWLGIGLGVLGVVVTLSDRLGRPPSAGALGWTLLGLAALVTGTLLQGRLQSGAGPAALASVELAAAALAIALVAPFAGSLAIPLNAQALLTFAYVAVVAGAGAPLLLFALIAQRGPSQASNLLFVLPSLTAFEAWLVIGTPIGAAAFFGFAIAGAGLYLARAQKADTRVLSLSTNKGWAREAVSSSPNANSA
jgi:drug/metabolite transporter (DMT)-like permease